MSKMITTEDLTAAVQDWCLRFGDAHVKQVLNDVDGHSWSQDTREEVERLYAAMHDAARECDSLKVQVIAHRILVEQAFRVDVKALWK
jgi:hypothetical protein